MSISERAQKAAKSYQDGVNQADLLNGTIQWDEDVPSDFKELLSTFVTPSEHQNTIKFSFSLDVFHKFIL